MKTNVLELVCDLGNGGAQALIRDYCRMIDYTKFNLFVCTLYPALDGLVIEEIKKTKAVPLSIFPKHSFSYRAMNNIFPSFFRSRRLLEIIKKYHIDVIHVHLGILSYLHPIRNDIKGVKLFYTCHTLPGRLFGPNKKTEFEAATDLIRDNDLVLIALHDAMRVQLNELFSVNNTIIIHNGVDLNRFQNISETRESIRTSIGIPVDAYVIGHVGRFAYMKNHKFLVEVFSEVYKRNHQARLLMVGSGPTLHDTLDLLEAKGLLDVTVHLENRTDINRVMKAMDVFVFPSLFEGLPVSVVEAQAANLRVVVSNSLTEECFFKPKLISLDLQSGVKTWADAVLDESMIGSYDKDMTAFDMVREIKRLENNYIYGVK